MPTDYHGPHVATQALDHEPIEWHQVHGPLETSRVITHTCECKTTIYELRNLGGAHYIRRTTRGSIPQIHESPKTIPKHTAQLWQ
jgi:hypothetical protein